MEQKKIAVIDMGSNSIRLVVNEIQSNGCYKELYNFKVIARLSSHIDEKDEISKNGIKIIIDTVKKFSDIIKHHHVDEVKGVATAAVRKAKNQKEVLSQIKSETGYSFRILSEYEEAFYGYLAVVNSTNIENGITIDIGGGSTEVTLFKNRKLKHYHSFPFGAITLKQMFMKSESTLAEDTISLKDFLFKNFTTLPWLNQNNYQVIGIGGTARNLSLMHKRKVDYPLSGLHQYILQKEEIEDIQTLLLTSTLIERQNMDGLSKDRADIIIPGIQAILSLVEYTNAPNFVMSNKGLRDGIFYEEILKQLKFELFPNIAEESFFQLSKNYKMNVEHVEQVYQISKNLYMELLPHIDAACNVKEDLLLLKYSSNVLYIGEFFNNEVSSQHTFYLLTNMTIDGLSHKQRLALAFISSFKSKTQLNHYYKPFKNMVSIEQLSKYELLGAILKFSFALNRTRQNVFQKLSISNHSNTQLVFHITFSKEAYFEEQHAQKYKKHLERVLLQQIELQFDRSSR